MKKKTKQKPDIVVVHKSPVPAREKNSSLTEFDEQNDEDDEDLAIDDLAVLGSDHEETEDLDIDEDSDLPAVIPRGLKSTAAGQDPLFTYLKEVSRYKLLTPAEEKALTAELINSGDIEVAKKLVRANLRLVVKIALEYRNAYQNVLDLIQEGNIGLMKAVSKYDPSKGAKLSYYASWWIRSYILKFILDNFRLVKIGTTSEQKKLFYNLMKEKQRLLQMGINPEVKLISENLGVSEKAVVEMDQRLQIQGAEISLDRPRYEDQSGGPSLGEALEDGHPEVSDVLADLQGLEILKQNLGSFLETLKPRDKEIFTKRLLPEVPSSLQSIADEYGVSRERIRQVEERLIEKLKVYMGEFLR